MVDPSPSYKHEINKMNASYVAAQKKQEVGLKDHTKAKVLYSTPNTDHTRKARKQLATFDTTRDLVFYIVRDAHFRFFLCEFCQVFLSQVACQKTQQHSADPHLIVQRTNDFFRQLVETPLYRKAVYNLIVILDEFTERSAHEHKHQEQFDDFREQIRESYQILGEYTDHNELDVLKGYFWALFTHMNRDTLAKDILYEMRRSIIKCMHMYDYYSSLTKDQGVIHENIDKASDYFIQLFNALIENGEYLEEVQELLEKCVTLLKSIQYGCDSVSSENDMNPDSQEAMENCSVASVSPMVAQPMSTESPNQINTSSSCTSIEYSEVTSTTIDRTENNGGTIGSRLRAGCITSLYIAQEHLRQMIIPLVKKNLEQIPIPTIEASKDKYEFRLEHRTLSGSDILPDTFDLRLKNLTEDLLNSYEKHDDGQVKKAVPFCQVKLRASNIHLSIEDMKFYFMRHKTPKIEDEGLVDVNLLETGLNFRLSWNVFVNEGCTIYVTLTDVKCFIDKTQVQVKKSRHKIISRIASKVFAKALRRQVALSFVETLKTSLEPVSEQINAYFNEGQHKKTSPTDNAISSTSSITMTTSVNSSSVEISNGPPSHIGTSAITCDSSACPLLLDDKRTTEAQTKELSPNINAPVELDESNDLAPNPTIPRIVLNRRPSVTVSDQYANALPGVYDLQAQKSLSPYSSSVVSRNGSLSPLSTGSALTEDNDSLYSTSPLSLPSPDSVYL